MESAMPPETTGESFGKGLLALGVVLIIIGILAIIVPTAASISIALLLGILLLVAGTAQLFHAFAARGWGGFFLHLLGAIVYLLFGLALLLNPDQGVRALTLLLAMFFMVTGFIKILMAAAVYKTENWGWLLANGIVAFILGALIWAQWPDNTDWVIGLLVGIDLVFSGFSLLMLRSKKADSGLWMMDAG